MKPIKPIIDDNFPFCSSDCPQYTVERGISGCHLLGDHGEACIEHWVRLRAQRDRAVELLRDIQQIIRGGTAHRGVVFYEDGPTYGSIRALLAEVDGDSHD